MAVNHNVNPRPLTAEEKENRARGVYDSFATYVVFCGLGPTLAVATILIAQLATAAAIDAFGIMGTEELAFGWSK